MNWLIQKLVDNGWVRLGLSFRWILGTQKVLTTLVNEHDLKLIEKRYQLIEQSGFFSGEKGVTHQQDFIHALFAYDAYEGDAFSKALSHSFIWKRGSVEPLSAFLTFISRVFFQGLYAEDNKQVFFEAVLKQHSGERNALAHTASAKNPTPQQPKSNPLTMLLNALNEAGRFSGQHASENKQRFINGVFATNKNGENTLCNALQSRDIATSKNEDRGSNLKLLLNALAEADCFNGPFADSNKKAFIHAVLINGKYHGVLSEAMWESNSLQLILTALTDSGCFTNERTKQDFIDALFSPNCLGITPLSYATYIHRTQSLKLTYDYLKQAGCFTSDKNKQKLINAIFAQANNGESTLSNASKANKYTATVLEMLTEAGCFDSSVEPLNQQNFVKAVFAEDEHGMNCLYNSLNNNQILNQLMKIKYFEGLYGEQNKQAFIKAVFAPTQIGKEQQGSALSRNCTFPKFPLLIEHLTAAGCFSGSPLSPNKQAFLNAVFAKDKYGESMLSAIYGDNLILVLKKLAEADCFTNPEYKMKFCQAVRANGNAILFNAIYYLKSYLALHKSLFLAGFFKQDIKNLLNESIQKKYDTWSVTTPLMMALRYKKDLLVARLIADGAELTPQQQQQVEEFTKRCQKADNKVAPFNRAAIKTELMQSENSMLFKKPKLKRRASLSDLSLFAQKQSFTSSNYAADDTNHLIKSTAAAH